MDRYAPDSTVFHRCPSPPRLSMKLNVLLSEGRAGAQLHVYILGSSLVLSEGIRAAGCIHGGKLVLFSRIKY